MSASWGIDVTKMPGTKYEATLREDVVRVDAETVKRAARGVNRDHDIYFFENLPELREKLVPGKVVLFEGLTFKRIQAVAVDGSQLIVGTEDAALTDLFKDANIQWKVPINFRDVHAQRVRARVALGPGLPRTRMQSALEWVSSLEPRVYAAEGADAETGEGEEEGWKFNYDTKFSPDRLDFDVDLSRKGGVAHVTELDANITGKGYIKNFESSLSMAINNSAMSQFNFSNSDVNGAVDFAWTVGCPGPPKEMGEERIKLPALMSVPLFVGGVPFTLEIGEALLFHPAFTTKEEIAKGAFHVDYNGVTGLKVSSGGGEPANDSNASEDGSITTSKAFSPLAAFGVVIAVAMPRFDLKTGAEELLAEVPDSLADRAAELLAKTTIGHFVKKAKDALKTEAAAYFQVILSSSASHSGMQSLVPCQRFGLHVEGQVGANMTVLGIAKPLAMFKVFQQDIDQPTPPGKICTG